MGKLIVGLYKRNMMFFLMLMAIVAGFYLYFKNQRSQASLSEIIGEDYSGFYNIDLNIEKDGGVLINGKKNNKLIKSYQSYDELKYVAFEEEGFSAYSLKITVHLPEAISNIKQGAYAVHGVGQHKYFPLDEKTLVYTAYNLTPVATFTITAELPKGIIKFPWYRNITNYLLNLSGLIWIIFSLIFPALTLLILSWMLARSHSDWKLVESKETINSLPNNLAPAVAGVLLQGKISSRAIAATLLDLAHRGYLNIIRKEEGFMFTQRPPSEQTRLSAGMNKIGGLRGFEKMLLSKIFLPDDLKSTAQDIQVRIGRHVFSRKIAEVYLGIYQEVTQKNYFGQNPAKFHTKFYILGLFLFFLGLLGFVIGLIFAPEPKYLLLVWFGMILSSLIVVKISPKLPARTLVGQKDAKEWAKFKNFLQGGGKLSFQEESREIFEKYLPYSVVMGCEEEWASRFFDFPFRTPDWYISNKEAVTIEDFVSELFPMVSYIGQELAGAKEPIIE